VNEALDARAAALAPHFKSGFLPREMTTFQFEFVDGEPFYLEVSEGNFSFAPGYHSEPTILMNISDHETCWGLLDGRIDGMQAFMEGRYRADGNIVLSQLLLYLFKSNDPTIVYEIQY
jgi:putative sterol carrier protein